MCEAVEARQKRLGGSKWARPACTAGSNLVGWSTSVPALKIPASWIGYNYAVRLKHTTIGPKQNGRGISRSPDMAFGTRSNGCRSLVKKRMGYQERDPGPRRRFLRLRERFLRRGKQRSLLMNAALPLRRRGGMGTRQRADAWTAWSPGIGGHAPR